MPCTGDASGLTPSDFTVTTTGGYVPTITDVTAVGNTATLTLDPFIPVVQWTTFTHNDSGTFVDLGFLPTDVDESGTSTTNDLFWLIQGYNEPGLLEEWSSDVNRSGDFNTNDVAHWINMYLGNGAYAPGYQGVSLP